MAATAAGSAFKDVIARFAPASRRPRRFHAAPHRPGIRSMRRARCHARLEALQRQFVRS
ncbi:hypothetical protein WEH80_04805 [Actinomycetes bacterium KLBMP 9759]